MTRDKSSYQINIGGIVLEWRLDQGTCSFAGLPITLMWTNTTLAGLMTGLHTMVGTKRFALALQAEGRKSVDSDWEIISSYPDFQQGFAAFAASARVAGWGKGRLTNLDFQRKEAHFIIENSWEGRYQKAIGVCWGSAMLAGKLSGYGEKLFGENCWTEQTQFIANGDAFDAFTVRTSSRTIESELADLLKADEATRADMAVALKKLEDEIEQGRLKELELTEANDQLSVAEEELRRQYTSLAAKEQALRQSEERWQFALHGAGDGLWDWDAQTNKVFYSGQWKAMLGYADAEIGDSLEDWKRLVHPEDLAHVMEAIEQHFSGQTPVYHNEHRLRCKDGSYKWILDRGKVISRTAEGDPLRVIGTHTDISDRKRAELRNQQINSLYEELLKPAELVEKLQIVTDRVVEILDADFARVWLIRAADRCRAGCDHADTSAGDTTCQDRKNCLHLVASSGRYRHRDGGIHARIPLGWHEIGSLANSEMTGFVTNELSHDVNLSDRQWAADLGLTAFAGYRLLGNAGSPAGVLALFSQHRITADEQNVIETLANTVSLIVQTAQAESDLRYAYGQIEEINIQLTQEVSERKAAEDAITESQAYNRLLFRDSHIPLIVMDATTWQFTDCNEAAAKVYGFDSREDVLGKNPLDVSTPTQYDGTNSKQAAAERIRDCLEHGSAVFEWRHLRPNGEIWDGAVYLMRFEHRNEIMIQFSLQDITERKLADEALRCEKEFSETLIDSMPGIFFLYDSTLRLKRWNRAHEISLGFTADDLQDWFLGDWHLDPEVRRLGVAHARRQLETGGSAQLETLLINKQRQPVPYLVSTTRLLTPKGPMVMGMGIDISERKKTEQALQESESKYRMLVELAREAVWVTDTEHRLTFTNASGAEMLGYSAEQMIGRPLADFLFAVDLPKTGQLPLQLRDTGTAYEQRFRHADGSEVWCIVSATPIFSADGSYQGAFGMLMDITERKQAETERLEIERQLLHSQKLESLGVLAGGIAHDFNNLLMAIIGNLDLAVIDLPAASTSREFLNQALQASRRASDLTRQMLAYSGKGKFVLEGIDLSELVKENSHLFKASVAKTATLQLSLENQLTKIEADVGQLQQVIMNLITNASEAIGEQPGVIKVTTGERIFTEQELQLSRVEDKPRPGHFVFLEVTDTGTGMDERTLQRLFDPFYTTKFTGRGLGLAAVLGIMRGHQGAIMVETELGRGSKFRVLFPVNPDAKVRDSGTDATLSQAEPESSLEGLALVVDDEKSVRLVCKNFLERLGMQAISAEDGEVAVRLFKEHPADIALVILDLNMPQMDGISAFREMKRIRPDIQVILCSGYNEQEATQHFLGEGLADFIQKPYQFAEFKQKIMQVLRNEPADATHH
ncbi:PAS domain S-box protein [bacterium]|nr:PAS domain S-box protein [bacterium]